MSKETKQDRIVRTMLDQVTEHLHELKNLENNPNCKESEVEVWCHSFLKNCLGYTASTGYSIKAQESKGKMRPDLIVLYNDKPIFVVEVKKLGFDLTKSDFRSGKIQLSEYLNLIGNVQWGILTNGVEWKLFDFTQDKNSGVEVFCFDLHNDEEKVETNKKFVEEICYDGIINFHETSYTTKVWNDSLKETLAFSPETLAKAILSVDVVKYISRYVKGEHEFKASHEALTDKLYELLEKGLNDAISGWNEAKASEYKKYIKNQKRASVKAKRTKKAEPVVAITEVIPPLNTVEITKTDVNVELKKAS